MFPSSFIYEIVTLYVVLDPVAAVPIFLAVTAGLDQRQRFRVAAYAVAVAFSIFMFFISIGHQLLNALHIPMASFQLAGSLVLLIFGLQMTLGKVSEAAPVSEAGHSLLQRAIFPLATPCIAGSGSIMTVMMLTDNVEELVSRDDVDVVVELMGPVEPARKVEERALAAARFAGERNALTLGEPKADAAQHVERAFLRGV